MLSLLLGSEDKVQELVAVLADDGLGVAALHVVPLDPVLVEVVEDGHARLVLPALPLLPARRKSSFIRQITVGKPYYS